MNNITVDKCIEEAAKAFERANPTALCADREIKKGLGWVILALLIQIREE